MPETTGAEMKQVPAMFSAFLFIAAIFGGVSAYPAAAGCCKSGISVGGGHMLDETGALADGDYELLIDDTPIDNITQMCIYQIYDFTVRTTMPNQGGYFRGFMGRVSGTDDLVSATNVLALSDESADVTQIMPTGEEESCPSRFNQPAECLPEVSGISHTSATSLTEVTVFLSFEYPGLYDVEMTVVRGNFGTTDDGWFHSLYVVNATDCNLP